MIKYYINKILIFITAIIYIVINKFKGNIQPRKEIIIVSVQHLGESILFIDALMTLQKYFSERKYKIRFVGNQGSIEIYRNYVGCQIEEYISVDKEYGLTESELSWTQYKKLCTYIDNLKVSFVITPNQSVLASLLTAGFCCREKYCICVKDSEYSKDTIIIKLYTFLKHNMGNHIIWNDRDEMLFLGYKELLRRLGISDYQISIGKIEKVDLDNLKYSTFGIINNYCVIVPGAQEKARRWETDKYRACISHILNCSELQIVILGSKDEIYLGEILKCNYKNNFRVLNLIGKTTIGDLIGILSGAQFVFGNDTGTIHIAAAVGVPSICLVTYKDIGRYHPYYVDTVQGDKAIPVGIWCLEKPNCAGCNINSEAKDKEIIWPNSLCRNNVKNGKPFMCLSNITIEQVVEQINIFQIGQLRTRPK